MYRANRAGRPAHAWNCVDDARVAEQQPQAPQLVVDERVHRVQDQRPHGRGLKDPGEPAASLASFASIGSRNDSVLPEPVPVVMARLIPSRAVHSSASAWWVYGGSYRTRPRSPAGRRGSAEEPGTGASRSRSAKPPARPGTGGCSRCTARGTGRPPAPAGPGAARSASGGRRGRSPRCTRAGRPGSGSTVSAIVVASAVIPPPPSLSGASTACWRGSRQGRASRPRGHGTRTARPWTLGTAIPAS